MSRLSAVLILIATTLSPLHAVGWPSGQAQPGETWAKARPAVQAFAKYAIGERLAAGDIPDLDLRFGRSRALSIRREIRRSHTLLSDEALPHVEGFTITLRTVEELQADTDKAGRSPMFIIVDDVRLDEKHAAIELGTDILIPTGSRLMKLCCCIGTATYAGDADKWTFQSWSGLVCSSPPEVPGRERGGDARTERKR